MSFESLLDEYNKIPGAKEAENMPIEDGQKNIINIAPFKKDQIETLKNTRLFRVMRKSHFLNWVSSGKNVIVSAEKWDDPWERALFKQCIRCNGEDLYLSNFRYYGQCWSMNEKETDVIWRVFNAHDEDCVRVEVNAFDLWNSFTAYVNKISGVPGLSDIFCSCGIVRYLNENDTVNYLESSSIEDLINTNSFVDTMYVKRDGFSHENEFRIIYYPTDVSSIPGANPSLVWPSNGLFAFDMDASLIRSVLFGPKISSKYEDYLKHKDDFEEFKSSLEGSPIEKIERSALYDFPQLNIKFS